MEQNSNLEMKLEEIGSQNEGEGFHNWDLRKGTTAAHLQPNCQYDTLLPSCCAKADICHKKMEESVLVSSRAQVSDGKVT